MSSNQTLIPVEESQEFAEVYISVVVSVSVSIVLGFVIFLCVRHHLRRASEDV